MVKKWRSRERSIKEDTVRRRLRGKDKKKEEVGMEEHGRSERDERMERGRNRQGFMMGEKEGQGILVCLWWRNEFCLWILLTPPQHNIAL